MSDTNPRIVLWDASMGVPTMNSAVDGFALEPREMSVIQNFRVTGRGLKVRYPYTKQTVTGLSGFNRGSIVCNLNGKVYKFVAIQSGQYTNVYRSTGSGFTAITDSAGAYGDSRLLTPSSFVPSATNTGTDTVTAAAPHNIVTGQRVGVSVSGGNLTMGTTYYAGAPSTTTLKFYTTLEAAIAGSGPVDITASITATIIPDLTNSVTFEVVRETATGDPGGGAMYGVSGRDLLVISDGATVLVYDVLATTAGNSFPIAKHINAWHPGDGKVRQSVGWADYLDMSDANVGAGADGSGNITVNDNEPHPDTAGLTPYASFGTSTVATNWAKFAFTTGDTVCSGKQMHMLFDCPSDRFFMRDRVKIEVSNDDSTYYTVYAAGTSNFPEKTDCEKGFTLFSFYLDPNVVPAATIVKYVKVTYTYGSSPATAVAVYFLGFMGGGNVKGGTLFRPSFYNSGSRAESIGVTCEDRFGVSTGTLGCQDNRNYVQVPGSTALYYTYYVTFQSSSTANRDSGLDYLLLYARAPGSRVFLYVTSQILAQYSAGWTFNTVNGVSQAAGGDNVLPVSTIVYYSRKAPDGQNMAIPPFKCATTAGGRLFVGNCLSQNGSASDQSADVYYSEQDHPFRFRDVIGYIDVGVPDPASGARIVIPGERVTQLKALVGDHVGAGAVLAWTNKSLWSVDGVDAITLSRPQKVMEYGTVSPWSVCVWQNKAVWLDDTQQVRIWGPSVYEVPSRDQVDNITSVIPLHRLSYVSGFFSKDVYRMAYTIASGSVNTVVLLYSVLYKSWTRDAPLLSPSVQFGTFFWWENNLYNFTEDGLVYKCDDTSATQDSDGVTPAPIVPYLQLRETHDRGASEFQFKRIAVLMDSSASVTLDGFWTDKNGNVNYTTGTTYPVIDIGSTTKTPGWVWCTAGAAIQAPSAYPTVKGQTATGVPSNKQIYAIVGEVIREEGDKIGA